MFELAMLLSVIAIIAIAWFVYKDKVAEDDSQRIRGKTEHLRKLEKSVKRLGEDLKDV